MTLCERDGGGLGEKWGGDLFFLSCVDGLLLYSEQAILFVLIYLFLTDFLPIFFAFILDLLLHCHLGLCSCVTHVTHIFQDLCDVYSTLECVGRGKGVHVDSFPN